MGKDLWHGFLKEHLGPAIGESDTLKIVAQRKESTIFQWCHDWRNLEDYIWPGHVSSIEAPPMPQTQNFCSKNYQNQLLLLNFIHWLIHSFIPSYIYYSLSSFIMSMVYKAFYLGSDTKKSKTLWINHPKWKYHGFHWLMGSSNVSYICLFLVSFYELLVLWVHCPTSIHLTDMAKLVAYKLKSDHISTMLKTLPWLSTAYRKRHKFQHEPNLPVLPYLPLSSPNSLVQRLEVSGM